MVTEAVHTPVEVDDGVASTLVPDGRRKVQVTASGSAKALSSLRNVAVTRTVSPMSYLFI